MNVPELLRTKTFWSGVGSIATGIGIVISGDTAQGAALIVMGILAICGRDAIETNTKLVREERDARETTLRLLRKGNGHDQ